MPRRTNSDEELLCSFCGKWQRQVDRLIAGPGVYICDECVAVCNDILDERPPTAPSLFIEELPKPREIYRVLDQYVVGQDQAKRILSVAVYNHYKRVQSRDDDVELQKSNILLLGPTGCGKTLFAKTLARILDVPFAIADATVLTEAGYVGEDVESILLTLLKAADYDIEQAQNGIVYIDEVDKTARRADGPSITRDVSGEGVQQALLKILEGTTASVRAPDRRNRPEQEPVSLDTDNVLFICGGSFDGLERMIERRIGRQGVGFGATIKSKEQRDVGETLEHCRPEDLVEYGLIPEFVGRLPVICPLHQLGHGELIRVLTEPRNAVVAQFQRLFQFDGIELVFAEGALGSIAHKALLRAAGARGLRSVIEELLLDLQFELPSRSDVRRCVVTRQAVERGLPPTLEPIGSERAAA
jgi:ATP-dependent Clp protease ATP-binding subunit ClpX